MGIKESDTIDSKTRSFIYDFVQKKQITKTNHGCRSNGIEHNNGYCYYTIIIMFNNV